MEKILKKMMSRKQFLKSCALLAISVFAGINLADFLLKAPKEKKGYGFGAYGE